MLENSLPRYYFLSLGSYLQVQTDMVSRAAVWQHCFVALLFFILCFKRQCRALTKSLSLRQPPGGPLLPKVADDFGFQLATSHRSLIITDDKQLPSANHTLFKCAAWASRVWESKIPGHFLKSLCCPQSGWRSSGLGSGFYLLMYKRTKYGPEKLAWRPVCLVCLFLCTPFCSVVGGPLKCAFISESPVGYYPIHFIISCWDWASVHHYKVIFFSYCRCWEEGWPADSKIAWYWWALGFVTVVKHTSFDSCLCMEKTIDD